MDIVDGRGGLVRCDEDERPDLLRAARVGVGALGIVVRMTLLCVPAFDLHAVEPVEPRRPQNRLAAAGDGPRRGSGLGR